MNPIKKYFSIPLLVILYVLISISIGFTNEIKIDRESLVNKNVEIYSWEPTSSKKNLPNINPIPSSPQNQIEIKACRGEFTPSSFVIHTYKYLSDVEITTTDLIKNSGGSISSKLLDVKLVKCWYQAGNNTIDNRKEKILVPELLLNDNSFIKVDYNKKINYIKIFNNPIDQIGEYIDITSPNISFPKDVIIRDADKLQPFNMPANTNMQIWLTIHVPIDVMPGIYSGTIDINSNEGFLSKISLSLTVLPFDLDKPLLEYGLYYRGKLTSKIQKGINSEWKDTDQYFKELTNIFNHGIAFPTIYQELKSNKVHEALKIRNEIGFSTENLYVYGTRTDDVNIPKIKNQVFKEIAEWLDIASLYSYLDVYIYGRDEAKGVELSAQRQAWTEIQLMGAKIFVACGGNAADIIGDILDKPVFAGNFNFKQKYLQKWVKKGKPVLSYDNPQVGIENPKLYRLNYGFKLLCDGYAGAMPYAYQHAFGHIWNDYDHKKFRDHVFAYPTSVGVIDTIQWEGFREAINDIRYISTLINKNKAEKNLILKWLREKIKTKTDPSEIRNQIIKKIEIIN